MAETGEAAVTAAEPTSKICGIVRPIATWDGCNADHWEHMQDIIAEACADAGYAARLVSEMTGAGVIQANIVRNIYNDVVTICDVSGRNPNVMFELGMRVAFQKPVIIVVDDATPFSFDISPVRHIIYPRDREYKRIVRFKEQLVEALRAAEGVTGYLSQFGEIHVASIGSQTMTVDQLAQNLMSLTDQVSTIARKIDRIPVAAVPRATAQAREASAVYQATALEAADLSRSLSSGASDWPTVAQSIAAAARSATATTASRRAAEQMSAATAPLYGK